jgi:hypothetical protein
MEQASVTAPVNPLLGVTVTFVVAATPGVTSVMAEPLIAKFGMIAVPLTVTVALAVAVTPPDTPLRFTV